MSACYDSSYCLAGDEEDRFLEGIRLETEVREIDGVSVLKLNGEIDVYTAPQFREAISALITSGQKNLVIDLADVSYMDSSGFGALLSATKKLKPTGGSVILVQCNSAIDRILRITRLDTVFGTYKSVDEAVAAIKPA